MHTFRGFIAFDCRINLQHRNRRVPRFYTSQHGVDTSIKSVRPNNLGAHFAALAYFPLHFVASLLSILSASEQTGASLLALQISPTYASSHGKIDDGMRSPPLTRTTLPNDSRERCADLARQPAASRLATNLVPVSDVRHNSSGSGCALSFVTVASPLPPQLMHNREIGRGLVAVPQLKEERDGVRLGHGEAGV